MDFLFAVALNSWGRFGSWFRCSVFKPWRRSINLSFLNHGETKGRKAENSVFLRASVVNSFGHKEDVPLRRKQALVSLSYFQIRFSGDSESLPKPWV